MFRRFRLPLAVTYWLLVVFVYAGLPYVDRALAEDGILLAAVSLPWSLLVLLVATTISTIPGVGRVLLTEGGNFLMFVVVCGGLNMALIIGASRVSCWLRSNALHLYAVAAAVVFLVVGAQLTMPMVNRGAIEYHRPQNVPKDAVYVVTSMGFWQHCRYDSGRQIDQCRIWNRSGLVLVEGDFVPYDGGLPATQDQLQIVDAESGPDRIALRNNRMLIPKSREAQMRRFLDWLNGKRATP